MNNRGLLIVFSGPSGSGKDTVLGEYLKSNNAFLSVSLTTRKPRESEVDSVDYFFVTEEEMKNLIAGGGVLEYTEYCGNYYGTPKYEVERHLNAGQDVILEIETEGAFHVQELMPEAVLVFIAPPSMQELRRRLIDRGTDDPEIIEKRLETALEEMALATRYDYVIVNERIDQAATDLRHIICAEKMRSARSQEWIEEVVNHG